MVAYGKCKCGLSPTVFVLGEAAVPFFHASGSEFDEIFVGTGAKRVRQLFGKHFRNLFLPTVNIECNKTFAGLNI